MKIKATLLAVLSLCAYASQTLADDDKDKKSDKHEHKDGEKKDDDHGHDHGDHEHGKIKAGPNGGRVITSVEPHLEFFVNKDRTVKITVLDDDNKAVKVGKQSVKLVAGDRKKPTKLTFEEKDGVLVSSGKLPDGNDFPVIVQIKNNKLSKRVNEKFNLNLSDCPSCKNKEYACECEHGHDDGRHDGVPLRIGVGHCGHPFHAHHQCVVFRIGGHQQRPQILHPSIDEEDDAERRPSRSQSTRIASCGPSSIINSNRSTHFVSRVDDASPRVVAIHLQTFTERLGC